jgi:hypothetical protein
MVRLLNVIYQPPLFGTITTGRTSNLPSGLTHGSTVVVAGQPPSALPSPVGVGQTIIFMDALGTEHQIMADAAHIPILEYISNYNREQRMDFSHPREGDFTPEEMERAKRLIDELG